MAEIDISSLSEAELISLRDRIDAKLADMHTITTDSVDPSLGENEISYTGTTLVDDFECSIKEVNWYSSTDFDFDCVSKENGFEYIVIVLSEKNTTNETENAPMINVLSADGQQCNTIRVLCLYKNQYKINFGATMPNTTADAYFIYRIPAGSQTFRLQVLSNGFGSNSEYFVFNRNNIN